MSMDLNDRIQSSLAAQISVAIVRNEISKGPLDLDDRFKDDARRLSAFEFTAQEAKRIIEVTGNDKYADVSILADEAHKRVWIIVLHPKFTDLWIVANGQCPKCGTGALAMIDPTNFECRMCGLNLDYFEPIKPAGRLK